MTRKTLVTAALLVSAVLLGSASSARAQLYDPLFQPRITILPSRTAPGANIPIPGTTQVWNDPYSGARGYRYLGIDGQWHGGTRYNDPNTGTEETVYYNRADAKSNGTTAPRANTRPTQVQVRPTVRPTYTLPRVGTSGGFNRR